MSENTPETDDAQEPAKLSLYDLERRARNSSLTDPTWRTDYRVKRDADE